MSTILQSKCAGQPTPGGNKQRMLCNSHRAFSMICRVHRPMRTTTTTATHRGTGSRLSDFRIPGCQFSTSHPDLSKRYATTHEWAEMNESESICTVGISKYAAAALGDIVFLELSSTGTEAKQGTPIAVLESVKSVSDVVAPISGTVVEINQQASDALVTVGQDPEGSGWLVKMSVADGSKAQDLMTEAEYQDFVADK